MTPHTRFALATTSTAFEQRLRRLFAGTLNGDLRRLGDELLITPPEQLVRDLGQGGTDVVALGPGLAIDTALQLAHAFDERHPEISVVLVAQPSAELWELALRAGVRDVIAPESEDEEIQAAFERAMETAARRRENLAGPLEGEGTLGSVITVVSPKGGSGKTTIVSNLAVGLAQLQPNSTVVVDLDLQFGDVSTALRMVPEHTIADVARSPGRLDQTALKVFLTPHPSGLFALCSPENPAEGDAIRPERITEIIGLLREQFLHVVVDTSAGMDEHTLAALDLTTDIVLVCTMDVPSIRGLRKEVQALDQLGLHTQRRLFVLNRADSRVGLRTSDVEGTVGMEVNVGLPSSRTVPLSMNQGVPVVESDPRSPVARQIRELIACFAEIPTGPGKRAWKRGAR